MSATRIVQARQHLPRRTPADISFSSEACKVTQQRRRIRLLPSRAGKVSNTKHHTHTTLQSHSTGEATELCKLHLQQQLAGVNRGIFGVKAAKSEAIETLLSELQQLANDQHPTEDLTQLSGKWNLIYTSLVIKGARKTKLGLREFVSLGDFEQIIDTESKTATNRVHFSVTGLGNLSGSLTIIAKFEPVSAKRVQITYESAALVPKALERLFASNYDLLLSIFNPEGWLDITYVDDTHRIGRDDKDNVFYLQRS